MIKPGYKPPPNALARYSGSTSSLTNIDAGIKTRPNGVDKSITPGSSTDQSAKFASMIVSTVPEAPPRSKRTLSPILTSTPLGYFIGSTVALTRN